ncbi:hypothetical protein BJ742DRAFT_859821 [Cladochytrium replicatum]|nr:hypothetical protein BJ742DRAFT_859821 [Cladochytrium replicatum]
MGRIRKNINPPPDSPLWANQTPIRSAERFFKRRDKPVDLSCCIDFRTRANSKEEERTTIPAYINNNIDISESDLPHEIFASCPEFGNHSNAANRTAQVLGEGLIVIQNPFTPEAERRLIRECLRDYTKRPNVNNLDTHYVIDGKDTISGLWQLYEKVYSGTVKEGETGHALPLRNKNRDADSEDEGDPAGEKVARAAVESGGVIINPPSNPTPLIDRPLPVTEAIRKIRWTSLGYYYDWTRKEYHNLHTGTPPPPIPTLVSNLCRAVVKAIEHITGFPAEKYNPEAGIVNFYGFPDSLTSHQDRSELDAEAPLVSFSLGYSCIFLIGTESRDDPPTALVLHSGDILVMSGKSRRKFHGVPRILEGTLPEYLRRDACVDGEQDDWGIYGDFIEKSRINPHHIVFTMEALKLYKDLLVLSKRLDIPFLSHFFKITGWSHKTEKMHLPDGTVLITHTLIQPRHLKDTISNFHIRQVESADYRSAYHQICDWFYGWNVTDGANFEIESVSDTGLENDVNGTADEDDSDDENGEIRKSKSDQNEGSDDGSADEERFRMRRVPRDINLQMEGERVECDRILKSFETLFSMSRRIVKKTVLDIEEELPSLGEGVSTLQNRGGATREYGSDDSIDEKVGENGGLAELERVWAKRGRSRDDKNLAPALNKSEGQSVDFGDSLDSIDREIDRLMKASKVTMDGVVVKKKPKAERTSKSKKVTSRPASASTVMDDSLEHSGSQSSRFKSEPLNTTKDGSNPLEVKAMLKQVPDAEEEMKRALLRDINHIYREVDKATEYTLVAVTCGIVVLGFSQLLRNREKYAKMLQMLNELGCEFVATVVKTVYDLLSRELPGEIETADVRHPPTLKAKLKKINELRRSETGSKPNIRTNKLHSKFALLNDLFSTIDVHVFPHFVWGHQEGCKSIQYSAYDPSLWLTGGYDCTVRIHDLRKPIASESGPVVKNGQPISPIAVGGMCLAQYVGHKSVITDVRFVRDDTHIVSCSLDRTLKIWNAQSATCEKTLVGHTDGVTTCDITPDFRVIASGSIDGTIRLWDFITGQPHCTLKKHSRWVKVVRFTHDGKYLITGGLDRRIFLWETKLLMNARNVTHARCFENHVDYILDVASTKPSLLLSTSRDCTVRLSDYISGQELHVIKLGTSWACTVAFSGDGELFAAGCLDSQVNIYRTKGADLVRKVRIFNLGILCVRFPSDLSHLVVGTVEGFLQKIPL